MYDFLHGIILSLICSTGFLSVYYLMEIAGNLRVQNRLAQENNAILRAIAEATWTAREQLERRD